MIPKTSCKVTRLRGEPRTRGDDPVAADKVAIDEQ